MNDTKIPISSVIRGVEEFLSSEDLDLMYEFLSHGKISLTIEFICDKLEEYSSIIPEGLGKRIQVISGQLSLCPARSWEGIIIWDTTLNHPRRLQRDIPDFGLRIERIYEPVKNDLGSKDRSHIEEFLEHDECELAIDCLCACLTQDRIPISLETINKIREIFLDLDMDPERWKGFVIKPHSDLNVQ